MRVLVTGAFGSLGREFTRFLLKKHQVTGVDNNEWALASFPDHPRLTKKLMDFADLKGDFDLIIHCAAYKHIELIEENQDSAYKNNVDKLNTLLDNCSGEVLFISTDKAVNPSSFYGMTKQLGEAIILGRRHTVARLGNLKSSSGSVIPIWEECYAQGRPLPITNPDMTRYMIEASDAVKKIMALYPKGKGKTIIPTMGEPVRVGDLVAKLFPNVQTEIIGLRKGEKMHEELKWETEKVIYQDINGEIIGGQ